MYFFTFFPFWLKQIASLSIPVIDYEYDCLELMATNFGWIEVMQARIEIDFSEILRAQTETQRTRSILGKIENRKCDSWNNGLEIRKFEPR